MFLFTLVLACAYALAQSPAEPRRVQPSVAPVAGDDSRPAAPTGLRIGSGDLLEITVFGVPDLSQSVRVSAAGDISLSLVGLVPVAGLSAEEAQERIEELLSAGGFLKDPHVTVFMREFATQGVSVLGEVMKPGIYPLMSVWRIPDVIAAAGGLSPKAAREVVITRKYDPDRPLIIPLEDDGQPAPGHNVEIYPGDTVQVAKAGLVYVVGEVGRPGGFVMERNTHFTVLQAIAMAQGLGRNPAMGSARLIRKTETGMQEIPIPLRRILDAKAPDLELQAEDIVFVPTSFGRGAAKKTLDVILQTASSAIIYRR